MLSRLGMSIVFMNLRILSLATEIVCISSSPLLPTFLQAITIDFNVSTFKTDALTSLLAQGQVLQPTAVAHVFRTMISGIHCDVNTKATKRAFGLLRSPSTIPLVKKLFNSLPDMH